MGEMLAVLFGDLRGFTSLTAQKGDEAAYRIARAFVDLVADAVERGGGEVRKTYGDGVMASFGDPDGAVRASIGVQRALHERNPSDSDDAVAAGVGVSVGDVLRADDDLFGHTVNFAKRLADLAKGGQIVASSDVARRCRGVAEGAFRDLGPRELKGIGRERIYEVVWRDEVAQLSVSSDALNLVLTEDDRLVVEFAKPFRERIEETTQQLLEEAEAEGGLGGLIKRAVGRRLLASVPRWIETIEARAGMELDRPIHEVEARIDRGRLIIRLGDRSPIVLGPSEVAPSDAKRFVEALLARQRGEAPPASGAR